MIELLCMAAGIGMGSLATALGYYMGKKAAYSEMLRLFKTRLTMDELESVAKDALEAR